MLNNIAAITNPIPVVKPVVTGGTLASDATYFYRTFTGNGTLTVTTANLICDYLVVAGGGSGGTGAGGGGAGGLRSSTAVTLTPNSYSVVIGAGGSRDTPENGNTSSFNSLNTSGGGRGAVYSSNANSGGSGGGGRGWLVTRSPGSGNAGGYSPVEGFAGTATSVRGGGGGGSATAVGGSGSGDFGGLGADGSSAFSSWGSATSTGQNVSGTYYYAGGGAGGTIEATATPRGGYGGGGQGNYLTSSLASAPLFKPSGFPDYFSNADVNTGGGGGGGGGAKWTTGPGADNNDYDGLGGAGGSGIVIVRYLKTAV